MPNGRILRQTEERPEVFEDGSWVPAEGVTVGAAIESLPLLDSEIQALVDAGILPNNDPKDHK